LNTVTVTNSERAIAKNQEALKYSNVNEASKVSNFKPGKMPEEKPKMSF
jgi:hypothetical protein